ncbi:MAG: gephyrin-like molybdotransferase Glp [Gemmatimonadales bacterium]
MRTGLSAREAALEIVGRVARQPNLRIPLDDALGAVLAEPVVSPIDVPFFTNSAMDGYAARADDVRGASQAHPVRLEVIDRIPAGGRASRSIGPGQCARIFTGAPLPEGADSVVRQEDTDQGERVVTIHKDRDAGINWRRAGEDIARGSRVLEASTLLGPAELGVLASLAVSHPLVVRRPRVGILASGDEIVDVDQPDEILSGAKVASSNTHTLTALIRREGAEPVNLGIARDTPESLRAHLQAGQECDLLISTAGISVGEHDHLRDVLESLGGTIHFWKLRMRPGAPVGFGSLGPLPWIGLPGNPVSTMVTFELFCRPAIRKMAGHVLPFRAGTPVRVAEPIRLGPKLQHFLRAVVGPGEQGLEARLTGPQGSGILTSMVAANALLVVPEGKHDTAPGEILTAIVREATESAAEPPF